MHYSSPFLWSPSLDPQYYSAITPYFNHLAFSNFLLCSPPQLLDQNSLAYSNFSAQKKQALSLKEQNQRPGVQSESIFQENISCIANIKRVQNKGRNDFFNMLKVFFHQFKDNQHFKNTIIGIAAKKQYNLNVNQFLVKIKRKFIKEKTYVSPKQIIKYLDSNKKNSNNAQAEAIEVFKTLLCKFLKDQYFMCLAKTYKGEKQNRINLLAKRRQLFKILFKRFPQ